MPEVRRGVEYFEQAIAEDDSYALAYAGIADAMRSLVLSNDAPPAEMAPRAKETAGRAIELAPDLAEARLPRAAWSRCGSIGTGRPRRSTLWHARRRAGARRRRGAHLSCAPLLQPGPQAGSADARPARARAESRSAR